VCVLVGLQRNISPQYPLSIGYYEEYVEGSINTKFPDLQFDNNLNVENNAEPKIPTLHESPYAVIRITVCSYTNHRMQLGRCSALATAHSQNSSFVLFSLYNEMWNYWGGGFIFRF
jgi:hypothetical protein